MIAALPMYEFARTAPALDAVWSFMAERLVAAGIDAPASLTRGRELQNLWRDPGLLFGQTCGYPYRHGLEPFVEILATPVFAFEGCEGATHCSFLVARRDDARRDLAGFRGARAAINARDSNTGMNLFRAAVAKVAGGAPFFADVSVTGAHSASLAAVAEGKADLAAIDCVTFGLIARESPQRVAGVRVLARTPSSPALPFIASRALPRATRDAVREALFAARAAPGLAEPRAALGIIGVERLDDSAYRQIDEIEAGAARLGYAELA